VVVGARISKSGNATPQPGDLQGFSATVAPGAQALTIEIGDVVP
jgi:cytochrome c-type biogenesis protein CcmH